MGGQPCHLGTIDQAVGENANDAALALDVGAGGNVLAGVLEGLPVQENVSHQAAGIFKARGDAEIAAVAVEQAADVKIVERKGGGGHLDEAALDTDPKPNMSGRQALCAEVVIRGAGTVLSTLYGGGETPGLFIDPGFNLAGPGLRRLQIGASKRGAQLGKGGLHAQRLRTVP